MNCAKCGLDLPEGAKTCPKCGFVNEFCRVVSPADNRKKLLYLISGFVVVGVVAILIGVIASRGRVTSAPGPFSQEKGNVVDLPQGNPNTGNITTVPPGNGGLEVPGTPGVIKPKPTQEMVDYLEFVKQIEGHRQKLLKDTSYAMTLASTGQSQSLIKMIDMAMDPEGKSARDPLIEVKTELNRQYQNWLETLKMFDSKPAPRELRDFSGAYRKVLYSETQVIGSIASGFNQVNVTNPQDLSRLLAVLQQMKNDKSIQEAIDKAADDADQKLTQLTQVYDMQKPFNVPRETPSGRVIGF